MFTFQINMFIPHMQTCNTKLSCVWTIKMQKLAIATWPGTILPSQQNLLMQRNDIC